MLLAKIFVYDWNGTEQPPQLLPKYLFDTVPNPRGAQTASGNCIIRSL